MTGTPDTSAGNVESLLKSGVLGKLRSWERQVCTKIYGVECYAGLNCNSLSRLHCHVSNVSFSMHCFLITLTTMRDSDISKLLAQIGTPAEEDLLSWAHHSDSSTFPDGILQATVSNNVTAPPPPPPMSRIFILEAP